MEDNGMVQAALRFGSGLMLGLVLLAFGQPSFADVEDVVIPVPEPHLPLMQLRCSCVSGTASLVYILFFGRFGCP